MQLLLALLFVLSQPFLCSKVAVATVDFHIAPDGALLVLFSLLLSTQVDVLLFVSIVVPFLWPKAVRRDVASAA